MFYNIEKHYDSIASQYNKFEEYNPRKHILIKRRFVELFGNLRGLSVLDFGCGSGFFSLLAKKMGAKYVLGVDISQKQLDLAKQKSRQINIEYKKANIINLKINKKFDIVTAGFIFSYSPNRIILRKEVSAAYKHLKRNGKLFAVLCNPNHPTRITKILYSVMPATKGKIKDGTKLRCEFYDEKGKFLCYDYKFFWSGQTIENIMKNIGFQNIKWVDIKNQPKKSRIPQLPSTNIILYATKK